MRFFLTEKKLQEIVAKEVEKALNEMAMPLSLYKDKVADILPQIIENWCLVYYCRISGTHQDLRNHWASELSAAMGKVANMNIKGGNHAVVRMKALFYIWNLYDYDTSEMVISNVIWNKFRKENIDTTSEFYSDTISAFLKSTKEIINVLLTQSAEQIEEYIRNL